MQGSILTRIQKLSKYVFVPARNYWQVNLCWRGCRGMPDTPTAKDSGIGLALGTLALTFIAGGPAAYLLMPALFPLLLLHQRLR